MPTRRSADSPEGNENARLLVGQLYKLGEHALPPTLSDFLRKLSDYWYQPSTSRNYFMYPSVAEMAVSFSRIRAISLHFITCANALWV